MRQPLHAIGLFLGVLIDKVDKDDQKIFFEKIKKSSDALNGLLDSLLDISKLDAGVMRVNCKPFSLESLFDSLKNEFEPSASEKNISLKFVNTHLWLNTDFRLLERIARNLISNAIRYTQHGGIVVGCRRYKGGVMLAVYDTGIGIEKNKIADVFKEFYQLDNPERDRSKGIGLGLAIVKRMTALLDMSLLTVSVPNKGSMFGVMVSDSLISNKYEVIEKPLEIKVFFDNKNVLVVDDEQDIRDSLTQLLKSWHCNVTAVASGEEAVNSLLNIKPDIILADYRLRNSETGSDVINKVQAQYADAEIPAVIITGDTAPDRIKEANHCGYEILHKPVAPSELRELLNRIFNL